MAASYPAAAVESINGSNELVGLQLNKRRHFGFVVFFHQRLPKPKRHLARPVLQAATSHDLGLFFANTTGPSKAEAAASPRGTAQSSTEDEGNHLRQEEGS